MSAIATPPYYDTVTVFEVPANVGCDTVPDAVVVPLSLTFVPVKVGCDTVPVVVPDTLTSPSEPLKEAGYSLGTAILPVTSRTPVPVQDG